MKPASLLDLQRDNPSAGPLVDDNGVSLLPTIAEITVGRRGRGRAHATPAVVHHANRLGVAKQRALAVAESRSKGAEMRLHRGMAARGSLYLQKKDVRTGRITQEHCGKNLILDRGVHRMLDHMAGGGVATLPSATVTDTPGADCFSQFVLSSSRKAPHPAESNAAPNLNAGTVIGSLANTANEAASSFFLESENAGQDTIRMVFSFPGTDPIDDLPFSSIGWAEGADAGDTGTQSRWGARICVGRPASGVFGSAFIDHNDSAPTLAVSTERGSDLKANATDGVLTTVWAATTLDEAIEWTATYSATKSGLVSVTIKPKTAGDPLLFVDELTLQLDQGSGFLTYAGIVTVTRGVPAADGSGVVLAEFIGGVVTGLKQHFVNALAEGSEGITITLDVTQDNVDAVRLTNIQNGEVGVSTLNGTTDTTTGGTRLVRQTGSVFQVSDVGKVVVISGEILTEITNFVDGSNVDVSPAITDALSGVTFDFEENRSTEIADITADAADATAYVVNGTNNVLRARGGQRVMDRGHNGATTISGTRFSRLVDAPSEGVLTAPYGAEIPDGAALTMFDGVNNPGGAPPGTTYVFDKSASVTPSTFLRQVVITDADGPTAVATALENAMIGSSNFDITASRSTNVLDLTNDANGATGNQDLGGTALAIFGGYGMTGGHTSGDAGPAFTAGMVGYEIHLGNGEKRVISGFVNANEVDVSSGFTDSLTAQTFDVIDVEPFLTYTAQTGSRTAAQIIADLNDAFIFARLASGNDGLAGRLEAFDDSQEHVSLRANTDGQDSFIEIDTTANGSSINTLLGISSGGDERFGQTLTFVKANGEVLSVVYEFRVDARNKFGGGALV